MYFRDPISAPKYCTVPLRDITCEFFFLLEHFVVHFSLKTFPVNHNLFTTSLKKMFFDEIFKMYLYNMIFFKI